MFEHRKTSINLKLFNIFASSEDKLVFQTVRELAKEKNNMKTCDILESVRKKRGGRSISFKKVLNTLNVLDEYGLTRRKVISVGNSPVLVWSV